MLECDEMDAVKIEDIDRFGVLVGHFPFTGILLDWNVKTNARASLLN